MEELTYSNYESSENVAEPFALPVRWLKPIICVMIFGLPLPTLIFVPAQYFLMSFFAYMNCVLYGVFIIYFLNKGSLIALIPIFMPARMIMGSCLGTIYFALFRPDATYSLSAGSMSFLAGGVRHQLVIFTLLFVYFISMALYYRISKHGLQSPSVCRANLAYITAIIYMFMICFHFVSLVASIPQLLKEWAARLYDHYHTILLVVGSLFTQLGKNFRIFLLVFLAGSVLFYTVGNARGMAVFPIAAMLAGLFLLSEVKTQTKITIFLLILFALPMYMLIGETTRALTGEVGFMDFRYRLSLLKEWKYAAEAGGRDAAGAFFGRFFYIGGNTAVAEVPSKYPFRKFSLAGYLEEGVINLLPGPIFKKVVSEFYPLQYAGRYIGREYGLPTGDYTFVTISLYGSLWIHGGFIGIVIGGFVLALIHMFVSRRISRAWQYQPEKGLFYFAVLFKIMYTAIDDDLLTIFRDTIWSLIYVFVLYKFAVAPLVKFFGRVAPRAEDELGLEEGSL